MDKRHKDYIVPTSSFIDGKLINFDIQFNGGIKRIGYSSLRGFIRLIKAQNKKLKILGSKVTFTITLPIKEK